MSKFFFKVTKNFLTNITSLYVIHWYLLSGPALVPKHGRSPVKDKYACSFGYNVEMFISFTDLDACRLIALLRI